LAIRRGRESEGIEVVKKFIGADKTLFLPPIRSIFSLRDRQIRITRTGQVEGRPAKSSEEILRLDIEPSSVSIETLGYPYEGEDIVGAARFLISLTSATS